MNSLLEQLLLRPPRNGRFYTVAIDGRGGSGKTELSAYLSKRLPDFVILNGDDYFEPLQNELAWGHFNESRFETDILAPIRGGSNHIVHQPYDFDRGAHAPANNLTIGEGIVIERCFSFGFAIDWDFKIWVETSKDVCLSRGIARNPPLTHERVIAVWEQVWQPLEDEFIDGFRPMTQADLVIVGTEPFEDQLV